MADDEKSEVKEGELIAAPDFLEVVRYERGGAVRTYNLRVVPEGAELWVVTDTLNEVPRVLKEGLFTTADDTAEFLAEVHRTLLAGGWRQPG